MYIRSMQVSDIERVNAIELQSVSPWTSLSLGQELLRDHGVQYLLVDCDTIVAWVALHILGPEAELLKIAVSSEYRRRGLGSFFLTQILQKLIEQGAEDIFLEVREANVPACTLYEKIGFERIGRRKGYYQNPLDDALVYKFDVAHGDGMKS